MKIEVLEKSRINKTNVTNFSYLLKTRQIYKFRGFNTSRKDYFI